MDRHRLLLLLLHVLAAIAVTAAATAAAADGDTIYDHLRRYGLPIGLLPKGITDYAVDPATGEFRVGLAQPCNARFENEVHYDLNVTGTLRFGEIGGLSGVSAQELFLWFPVKGIRVDVPSSGVIHFDVGVADKQFSLSLFESPPDCTAAGPGGDDPQLLSLHVQESILKAVS
ncbi:uncharacterized protein LOC115690151 [Syzygium oleosum]|uniref:uncharacterized protein LOC115690151 n=1 Tax=Syzygium oleosum TaxID=219896 RepID=UPI0011D258A3|nr:uncharacterized protein LOC115690151 [Syzygium oleosum]